MEILATIPGMSFILKLFGYDDTNLDALGIYLSILIKVFNCTLDDLESQVADHTSQAMNNRRDMHLHTIWASTLTTV